MNILMVSDMIYPDELGGSGRYLREICQGLAARGHNVDVITRQWKGHQPAFENLNGIKVFRYVVNDQTTLAAVKSTVKNTKEIFRQLVEKTRYDVVNFHHPLTAWGLVSLIPPGGPAKVYTFHSPWHREYEIKTEGSRSLSRGLQIVIRKIIERAVLKKCSMAIVLSRYMEGQLRNTHKHVPISVAQCPGGVDIHTFRPTDDRAYARDQLGLPRDKTILLTVRRLTPRTGVENLIRAMADVVKGDSNTHLVIGGEGSLKGDLQHLMGKLGLYEHISFAGQIPDERLIAYYQAADYFILPTSFLEGFGLATVEALSCGLPVLGTPIGGTVEILSRLDKDLLFEDATSEAMAALILKYSRIKGNLRGVLGNRCRTFIENNYTWEVSVEKTEKAFASLILE